jgi:hypothetical protein
MITVTIDHRIDGNGHIGNPNVKTRLDLVCANRNRDCLLIETKETDGRMNQVPFSYTVIVKRVADVSVIRPIMV